MKTVNEMHLSKTNRIFYINEEGELFVQFRPNKQKELQAIGEHLGGGETVYYHEELVSDHFICGYVTRVTKSGVALKSWSIK